MSWLLVVQPDSVQADVLCEALRAHLSEDVVVTDSLDNALASIDQDIPDVVLLSTVIPAAVEDYLVTYLGTIPAARHVRILGIPILERSDHSVQRRARSLIPWRRRRPEPLTRGCDPETYSQDVIDYLSSVRALKYDIQLRGAQAASSGMAERRTEPRFSSNKVPWISMTRFGSGGAVLINVSSRGVLLRTETRPGRHALKRSDPPLERSRLTFELGPGHEVHATGRVIRCIPLRTGTETHYEIAFSFDHVVGLHLPVAGGLVPKPAEEFVGEPSSGFVHVGSQLFCSQQLRLQLTGSTE